MFDLFKALKERHSKLNLFRNKKLDEMVEKIKEQPYEEPERQYYSLGPTTRGRVMLKVHYNNISMTLEGIDGLIKVLEASKAWLEPQKDGGKQPEDACQEEYDPL